MGIVYRAHDGKLDEDVALKLLRPDVVKDDPSLLDRFKQEIKLARRITHRNVLRTHDFDEANGVPYISMEYLDGVTLKDLIRQKGALPTPVDSASPSRCVTAWRRAQPGRRAPRHQAAQHADHAGDGRPQDHGLRHRAVVRGQGSGRQGMTSTGVVMGTPDYMAPEQAQGQPADFRSDIYFTGRRPFEIFTGRLPFRGDSVMTVVLNHIQEAPPRPRGINPKMRRSLRR